MQKLTPMCGFETRNDDDSNDALSTAILSRVRKIVKFFPATWIYMFCRRERENLHKELIDISKQENVEARK